jgi:hypothetical protein
MEKTGVARVRAHGGIYACNEADGTSLLESGLAGVGLHGDERESRTPTMRSYDPLKPPDPQQWLALTEQARIALVQDYHRHKRVRLPNEQVHAITHAIVENQTALGDETPVRRTLQRLMGEGLDRHQAIHAIGMVLFEHIYDLVKAKSPPPGDPNPAYFAALERLTAEDWRRSG